MFESTEGLILFEYATRVEGVYWLARKLESWAKSDMITELVSQTAIDAALDAQERISDIRSALNDIHSDLINAGNKFW